MDGKTKLSPEVRRRLAELAAEARELIYGPQQCPEWGTSFAEMEADAKEMGHEIIRLLLEQSGQEQAQHMPGSALTTPTGESACLTGVERRTLETESGPVSWSEPKAYLPQSRKAFFPSQPGLGPGGG